ncbi:MAG: hypothetical protein AAFU85_17185 [Planctomycetota bacterium]
MTKEEPFQKRSTIWMTTRSRQLLSMEEPRLARTPNGRAVSSISLRIDRVVVDHRRIVDAFMPALSAANWTNVMREHNPTIDEDPALALAAKLAAHLSPLPVAIAIRDAVARFHSLDPSLTVIERLQASGCKIED